MDSCAWLRFGGNQTAPLNVWDEEANRQGNGRLRLDLSRLIWKIKADLENQD
jgi:hypothetical protein